MKLNEPGANSVKVLELSLALSTVIVLDQRLVLQVECAKQQKFSESTSHRVTVFFKLSKRKYL